MASVASVTPTQTAHKTAARPCLALVPAGFWTPVTVRPPRPVEPPVVCSVSTYWQRGDLTCITRHLKAGRAVAAQCGLTWCSMASRQIGLKMSGIMTRAGFPHRVELRINRAGFKTLLFIPEDKS
jgi:hypothetical protein